MSPRQRFLTGPPKSNPYKVLVHQDGLPTITVDGTMQQEGLIPPWLLPALIGLAALTLLLVLLWFVLLRPSIQSAATQAVAPQASAANAAAVRAQEAAAGQKPSTGGGGATGANPFGGDAYAARLSGGGALTIPADAGLSVTDLVFENPNGLTGDLKLVRFNAKTNAEQVLLQLKLENFRDLDFHFITPLTFQKNDQMKLTCRPDPGPDNTACDAYVYYTGYFKNPPQ
jgi:hypothetical protein